MKKLLLLSSFAIALLIVSCQSKAGRVIGKWTVSECSITNLEELKKNSMNGVPDSLEAEYKTKMEGQITAFIEESKKETYSFEKDSFDIVRRGKSDVGSWKISSDNKMLFLIPRENPAVEGLDIISFSAKELKLSKKIAPESSVIYTLIKN